jgi:predicted O-methyltransferase YrrM
MQARNRASKTSAAAEGILTLLAIIGLIAAAVFLATALQYRRRLYYETGRDATRGPITPVELDEFDDVFEQGDIGPTLAAEVSFIGSGRGVPGGTSDREAWVLAALAKSRRVFFEIGTATGKTTYLLARNSPADAEVHTITLSPEQLASYADSAGDDGRAARVAKRESAFTSFLYTGTDVEHKVTQLFGDSKALDTAPYRGRCDLIFVDGSHAYSYVMSDSRKALEMVAPGGIIIWHDYRPHRRQDSDVVRALAEIAREHRLVRLKRTSMVAYRAPS